MLGEEVDDRPFIPEGQRIRLTDALGALLVGAARRPSGKGSDPVVEYQTSFGGGKIHSMLAPHHMAGGTLARNVPGFDQLLSWHDAAVPEPINRVVRVGTWRDPRDMIAQEIGPPIVGFGGRETAFRRGVFRRQYPRIHRCLAFSMNDDRTAEFHRRAFRTSTARELRNALRRNSEMRLQGFHGYRSPNRVSWIDRIAKPDRSALLSIVYASHLSYRYSATTQSTNSRYAIRVAPSSGLVLPMAMMKSSVFGRGH